MMMAQALLLMILTACGASLRTNAADGGSPAGEPARGTVGATGASSSAGDGTSTASSAAMTAEERLRQETLRRKVEADLRARLAASGQGQRGGNVTVTPDDLKKAGNVIRTLLAVDANGNGKLDENEKAAAKAALARLRAEEDAAALAERARRAANLPRSSTPAPTPAPVTPQTSASNP